MKILGAILCGILLQSCIYYPLMHYSVAQNVPLITNKGEAQVSVATGTQTFGVQGSYGITHHLAAMGSFSYGTDDMVGDGDGLGVYNFGNGIRQSGELAVGYYDTLNSICVFEIYGGIERIHRTFQLASDDPTYSIDYSTYITKPFIQFDYGLLNHKGNGVAFSLKLGDMIYDHFRSVQTGFPPTMAPEYYNSLSSSASQLSVEPCISFRFGGPNVHAQVQLGTTVVPFADVFIEAGINVRFSAFNHRR